MTQLHTNMAGSLDTSYIQSSDNNHNIITPISPEPKNLQLQPQSPSAYNTYHESIPSFEDILSGTSPAPYSRVAFANFLKKIHSLENLEFLIHSNYYLQTFHDNDELQSKSIWELLYKNFISLDSPKEVNIPYEIKSELLSIYQQDSLPSFESISNTMITIKDLLRDGYLQFISSVKRTSINENYKFQQHQSQHHHHHFAASQQQQLPTPQYELSDPGVENYSPLDNTRSVSPLSYTEEQIPIPRSTTTTTTTTTDFKSDESLVTEECLVDDCCYSSCESKKSSVSSSKSANKNSISEVSKKIAGKLKWRRLSSNSSG